MFIYSVIKVRHKMNIQKRFCFKVILTLICILGLTGCMQITIPVSNPNNDIKQPKVTSQKYADFPIDCEAFIDSVSPDFKWATFICSYKNVRGMYVWEIGTKEPTLLFKLDLSAKSYFSPDGKKLIIVTRDTTWWLFNVGDWSKPNRFLSATSKRSVPYWSPDSHLIATHDLLDGWLLSLITLDGNVTNLLRYEDIGSTDEWPSFIFREGSWSPDSKKIAYVPFMDLMDTEPIEIWIIDVFTGEKEKLYSGKPGEYGYGPIWSPDGQYILFVNSGLENRRYESIYDVREGTYHILPLFEYNYSGKWSPDSSFISFDVSADISDDIYKDGLYIYSLSNKDYSYIGSHGSLIGWMTNRSFLIQKSARDLYVVSWQE